MKLLYIILDGAPDGFSEKDTALSLAYKPNIDMLAKKSMCGLAYIIGKGIAPESDAATLSLLGYDPEMYYTGRGPLEAIGAGLEFTGKRQVAIRANFATIDPTTLEIIDRRVGRSLTDYEAKILGESINMIKLDGGAAIAYFRHTIGHRGVVVIEHQYKELSGLITNTDPAYKRVGLISHALREYEKRVMPAKPMIEDNAAILTARLVNEYVEKTTRILDKHPINKERVRKGLLPANSILLRDAGHQKPELPPIDKVTGLKWASITEMPVEKGIAIVAGMKPIEIPVSDITSRKELLEYEAEKAIKWITQHEDDVAIYVHLKGPDEPGHDGDLESKIKAIEDIDRYFFGRLIDAIRERELAIIVTSDHSTPWYLKSHSDDPVPLMIYHPNIREGHGSYSEASCKNGKLGLIKKGSIILSRALTLLKNLK